MLIVVEGTEGVGFKSSNPDKELIAPVVGFYLSLELGRVCVI